MILPRSYSQPLLQQKVLQQEELGELGLEGRLLATSHRILQAVQGAADIWE